MKINSSKLMNLMVIMTSTMISMSSNNWMTIWLNMEINLFMFIPMMSKNKITNQSLKFFIIQSMSSHLIVFSIIYSSINFKQMSNSILMIGLLMKIGMAPFHIWMPEIMNKLMWNECILLTTALKITPMILINKMLNIKILFTPIILSMVVSSISGMNQMNLKKLMAFSSIFNLSWMTSSFLISKKTSILFMLIYTMMNFKIMNIFKKKNLIYMNQFNKLNFKETLNLNLNILSISGLPPLLGFFPKWMILKEMVFKSILLTSTMILTSMISMFMYMQINMLNFSNAPFKKKTSMKNLNKSFLITDMLMILVMTTFWKN